MLSFVLRCTRVPLRVGKVIRHAMRRHWGLSHHAAHVAYHVGVGTMLVCVAVPLAAPSLWVTPPASGPPVVDVPPAVVPEGIPGDVVPPRTPAPDLAPLFVPGLLLSPTAPSQAVAPTPASATLPGNLFAATFTPIAPIALETIAVTEPASLLVFAVGVVALLLLRRHPLKGRS